MIHLKLIAATICWALSPVFGRLVAHYHAPYAFTFGRFLTASLFLLCLTWFGRRIKLRIQCKHYPGLFLLGLTGICAHNVLVFMGTEYTEANRAAVILASIAIMIALIDWLVLGKRFHPGACMGLVMGFLGTVVVVTDGHPGALIAGVIGRGEYLLLASAASWAIYTLLGRPLLNALSPIAVTTGAVWFGTLLLALFLPRDAAQLPAIIRDPNAIAIVVFLGVLSSAIGFVWYHQAVDEIGAIVTAMYINLMPVFGIAFALLLLRETPTIALLQGTVLVVLGLVLVAFFERHGRGAVVLARDR